VSEPSAARTHLLRPLPRARGWGATVKGRLKFQIWSDKFQTWKTTYVLVTMLHENLIMMKAHGMKVRVGSECQ
jgi:hypothetical protein